MKTSEKHIWFPAKKYGWGWGLPCAWQGWVVMVLWVISLSATAFLFRPDRHFGLWIASVFILATVLFAICFAKGETPRWRWGESDEPRVRSSSERLIELEDLHRRQLISDAEYQAKREEILRGL